jgi:1,2-diacylglycerol 3-alpha-glucosyltransferase
MPLSIAVLWQRFGPYHLARLRGACGYFSDVYGIEVAGRDHYAWDPIQSQFPFHRTTLFADREYASLRRSELTRAVWNQLERIQPDAVAINGWSVPEAMIALRWCKRRDRLAILMSETFKPSGNRIKEWVKKRRVRRFDAAIVGGRWHRSYLNQLGFPDHRIAIGYDAVDNDYFASGAERARSGSGSGSDQLRRELALPERYFFANTRFLPRKNIDGLLSAFASFSRKIADWALVISGSGPMERTWKQQAVDRGIRDRVRWIGFLQYEQLPTVYGLASCFVHPAHEEPWGLVVNEACAAGLPVIVGDRVGASCELVMDGENGLLVDSTSESQLVDALQRIVMATDRERKSMGEASLRLVRALTPECFGSTLRDLTSVTTSPRRGH